MWFTVTPRMPYFSDRDYRLSMLVEIRDALAGYNFTIELPRHAAYNMLWVDVGSPIGVCEFMPNYPRDVVEQLQRLSLIGTVRETMDQGMCPPDPAMFVTFPQM
jgi:hypothetical protein